MRDKLLNVHASVSERSAFLIRLGDLRFERDDPFKARREVGHLALLFLSAGRAMRGGNPGQTPLSLRPFLSGHAAAVPRALGKLCL
jgi:hypothetical protein